MNKCSVFSILTTLIFILSSVFGQTWVSRYNGPANSIDEAVAIAVDNGGYIYVTGMSMGMTGYDYATIKYDSLGNEKWVTRYNGPAMLDDGVQGIVVSKAGNVYVTGISENSNRKTDYATVAYDSSGGELWAVRYTGPGDNDDYAMAICTDSFSNIYVTGISYGQGTDRDFATVKYDSTGAERWVARYNGPDNNMDQAFAIAVDQYGNVYVTGNTLIDTICYYATVKYDSNGTEQWAVTYDSAGWYGGVARSIVIDNLGYIYVTGSSLGPGTEYDCATISYDSAGTKRWAARYNGLDNGQDRAFAIACDNVSNIYITGQGYSNSTGYDYITIKYNSAGAEQWVRPYSGSGSLTDEALAINIDLQCNVCITGMSMDPSSAEDYVTVKYDSAGAEQWVARYNGPGNGYDEARAIAHDNAGNIYITGESDGITSGRDFATIKYYPTGIDEQSSDQLKNDFELSTFFYESIILPQNDYYKIFDVTGRLVQIPHFKKSESGSIVINTSHFPAGVYFVHIETPEQDIIKKVVKLK